MMPHVEQGDPGGVPLLLLHGWLDSRRCFEPLLALLPARMHAFAMDQRGHGDAAAHPGPFAVSDFAADVVAFMDAAGLGAAVLAGASSGGYVAQRVAVDHPGRVAALALLGSPRSLQGPRPAVADVVSALEDPVDPPFVRELNQAMAGPGLPEAALDLLCRENLRVPARVWRDTLEGLLAAEPPLDSGAIAAPALIVWGARDPLVPRADQETMAAEIPGARLVVYEDVGHLPAVEAPGRVGADLTALCDALAP